MKYRNIIFDFGNVLGKFDFDSLLNSCAITGSDSIKKAIMHNWNELDNGYDYDCYVNEALEMVDEKNRDAVRTFFDKWYLLLEDIEEVHEWVHELKKEGYRLYVLSNAPIIFEKHVSVYPIMKEFDGAVFSGSICLSKPDIKIYQYLLDKYQLKAEECFFIDDRLDNVLVARQCGMDARVYHHNLDDIKKAIH